MSKKKPGTAFGRWYANNKQALAERRRARYHNDPAYRARVKELANRNRKRAAPAEAPATHPHTFEDVSAQLEVSLYSLRDWRRRGYFPEPYRHNQRLYFSNTQVALLSELKIFLADGGARRPDDLETMKNTVFMNWES
jgi:hypothetical protein